MLFHFIFDLCLYLPKSLAAESRAREYHTVYDWRDLGASNATKNSEK